MSLLLDHTPSEELEKRIAILKEKYAEVSYPFTQAINEELNNLHQMEVALFYRKLDDPLFKTPKTAWCFHMPKFHQRTTVTMVKP